MDSSSLNQSGSDLSNSNPGEPDKRSVDTTGSDKTGSITEAIVLLGEHDEEAANLIWIKFFERLCNYARTKIYKRHRRLFDEGDIANQAFLSLFDGIKHQRFEKMQNRDDLWQMLTLIAGRKIANEIQHHDRQKRGNGKVKGESALGDAGFDNITPFVSGEPTPQDLQQFEQCCEELLAELPGMVRDLVELLEVGGVVVVVHRAGPGRLRERFRTG